MHEPQDAESLGPIPASAGEPAFIEAATPGERAYPRERGGT